MSTAHDAEDSSCYSPHSTTAKCYSCLPQDNMEKILYQLEEFSSSIPDAYPCPSTITSLGVVGLLVGACVGALARVVYKRRRTPLNQCCRRLLTLFPSILPWQRPVYLMENDGLIGVLMIIFWHCRRSCVLSALLRQFPEKTILTTTADGRCVYSEEILLSDVPTYRLCFVFS